MDGVPFRPGASGVLGLLVLAAIVVPLGVVTVPQVAGADHSYVVLSGSMEPTIGAGDVVLVREVAATAVAAGDVIAFASGETRVIHRVVEVVRRDGERLFRTKGDANEEADATLVPPERVVGEVTLTVPYLGHLLSFARTGLGTLALVVIPLGLLVASELRHLAGLVRRGPGREGS